MSTICLTCDTNIRLNICQGRDGEFKYCYRKSGGLEGIQESITPFDSIEELYGKISTLSLQNGSLRIEKYSGIHIGLLLGKFEGVNDDKEYPLGYITM